MSDPRPVFAPTTHAERGLNAAGRVWGGDRHRGRLKVPERAHPMVVLLFTEMNRQMTTIEEVSARSGVNYATIKGWRYRYVPNITNLDACFNAIGLRLTVREMHDQ